MVKYFLFKAASTKDVTKPRHGWRLFSHGNMSPTRKTASGKAAT